MAPSSLSLRWWFALAVLVLGVGCGTGNPPTPPTSPDQPDATRSKVELSRTANVTANGKDSVTITVTVMTADGKPLADRTVKLAVTGDGNTLSPATGKTDAQGVMTATLVSSAAGSKQVTVSVDGDGGAVTLATRPTVDFVPATATKLAFNTPSIQGTAGAPLTPVVEVIVQDVDGNKVSGNTSAVTLALASGPASAQLEGTVTVNAVDGVARFSELIIKQAGTGYSLRATSGSLASATSPTFDVLHGAPSVLELTGLPATLSAEGTASVQVTLKDAFGNLATRYQGTLHFSSTDAGAVLPADFTFTAADAGQKSFTGLALHTAGNQKVTVADTVNPAVTASANVQVVAGTATKLAFTQQPTNHPVRASLGTVQVAITDAYGNVAALTSPSITVALNPASAGLSGTTTVAPVAGVASFTTLSVAQEGTGYTLTATATGLTGATSAAFNIVDTVPPATPVLSQGATSTSSITVQWTAVGDDGNAGTATSQELRYSSTNIVTDADFAAATLIPTGAPQAAGSAESATLSGLTASTNYYVALKVTDNSGNSVRSATLPVSTSNPSITQLAFITQPVNGTAGTAMADVRVALQDASGTTVTSANSAVTLNLLNGPAFTPVTVTAVSGVATFSGLRIDTAGTGYQFQASLGSSLLKQSTAFAIRPGAAASLDLVGLVAPVVAGTSNTVQVTAYDAFGNVATGYTGTVHFTSTDGAATLPANTSFTAGDNGQKSISGVVLKTAGSQTVTVTDTANASLTDFLTVNVTSGAPAQLALSVSAAPVTAGNAFSVTVTLRDGFGNLATGYTGTVHFTSTDGSAVLPGDYAFTATDAGQKTFSAVQLRTAGSRSITVQDTGNASLTSTQNVTVNPAVVASLKLTAPATATAGTTFSVTVTARDAFNNVATGYTGTVQFNSGDAQATLPGNYTFTAGDAGSHLFNVTLGTAGSQSLGVGDGARSDGVSITVGAGPATSLSLTGLPASVTAGTATSVTVTARDAFNNVATGYTGTVHFSSTDGSATLPGDYPFTVANAGTASFNVTLRTAGARTVSVRDTLNASLTSTQNTTVNPAAAASLKLTAPATATAGTAFSVTVTARDAFNNVATGYTGTVQFNSGDVQATLPGNYTFTAGDAGSHSFSVTLGTAGSQSLGVGDGTRGDSVSITVGPGPAASLSLTGLPASVTAGTATSVTVTARDAFGNVATGYTGTVHFTSTDGSGTLPGDYTFTVANAGTASFSVTLQTAGARTVSVSGTGIASPVSASTTVSAAAATQLTFSVPPANGTVRATLATVKVGLLDAYGNTVSASSPTVTLALSGGNASSTLSGTRNVAPVNGVSSFTDLSIDQEGTGFQLVASAPGLTGATSAAFNIVDNLAPAAAVISAAPDWPTGAFLTWTAVGDDSTLGQAASYDLRYAGSPITDEATFAAATRVTIPAPQPAGAAESAHVTGLDLNAKVYFALKVIDGAGNTSLSNSPKVGGDPCEGYTCTPPANTCSANGRSVVSYTSTCMNSSGVAVCQDAPSTSVTCHSYETCSAGACVPVTAASQAGGVIISEFSSLGAEFIELRNTTGSDIDVHGFTLRNAADVEVDIRAITDPNGTAGTPVTVPANGVLYGIANPSGAIPGGTGFVYGPPGTSFSMSDTGDAIALYAAPPAGNLQDAVDFRAFVSDPNTPLASGQFVGQAGISTQLDDAVATAAGNDTATNWCVSFYGHNVRGSRITNTAGALNGSCKVAVINEVQVDPPSGDDGKWFMEIAGPGGAVLGGAKITDVEGKGATAGQYNTLGAFTIPAGTRIPADGILLVVDTLNSGITLVPNYVAGVDVKSTTFHLETGGGDAYQLISASGTLLDALGHDPAGANLAVTVDAVNNLPIYESATALYPTSGAFVAATLARSPLSTDTDNNAADFHGDPSPTPGVPNDTVNFTVSGFTPDDGTAAAGTANITVTGTDFGNDLKAAFGNTGLKACTVNSVTSATCTAPASGVVAKVSTTFTNPTTKAADVIMANSFTYTGTLNGTSNPAQADYCVLQAPSTTSVTRSTATELIYGRIYEAGVTDPVGAPVGVLGEVGYGTSGTDPRSHNSWRFFSTVYNTQYGNDDEFMGTISAPSTTGTYAYTYRFSFDNGLNWTYCDLNGAGSNTGLLFETNQLGSMIVSP